MSDEVTIKIREDQGEVFAELFLPDPIVEFLATIAPDHPEAREFLEKWGYSDAIVEGVEGE